MRIKICGVRSIDEVTAAVEAGATAVGFRLDRSAGLSIEEARALVEAVPRGVEAVGVFASVDDAEWVQQVLDLGVDAIQSSEEPPGLRRAGAFWIREVEDGEDLEERLGALNAGTILSGSLRGCTLVTAPAGQLAEWDRVERAGAGHPLVLSGGLTPENVREAIRVARPIGVDVSRGVEGPDGRKDPARMRAFVEAADD